MYYDMLINNKDNKYVKTIFHKLTHLRSYIFRKCNDTSYVKYKNYGGRGVTYDPKWNDLDTFIKDMCEIDGFNPLLLVKGKLALDKDIKNHHAKLYSKDTCTWVTNDENELVKPSRFNTYYGYNVEKGITYIFNQKVNFARRMGISDRVVVAQTERKNSCNSNINHTGWVFWSADDKNLPKVIQYEYSNVKNNIHMSSTTQSIVENYAHLPGGTFNKLLRSKYSLKKILDRKQILIVNDTRYEFNSVNDTANYFNISRSNLTSKLKKYSDFTINNYHFRVIKTNSVSGIISYTVPNLFSTVIDLTL